MKRKLVIKFNGDTVLSTNPNKKKQSRSDLIDPLDRARKYLADDLVLRSYQETGTRWLIERGKLGNQVCGGILADEMGLGKTIQTIAMIAATAAPGGYTLIITPLSVMAQWAAEIKKFSKFEPIFYHGHNRDKVIQGKLCNDKHNIVLTTYGVIVTEEKQNSHNGDRYFAFSWMFRKVWDTIILDEGHEIRTRKTKRYRAADRLKACRKYILTGTPVHNSAKDFMTLLIFLGVSEDELKQIRKKIGYKLTRKEGLKELNLYSSSYMLRREKAKIPSLILPKKRQWLYKLDLDLPEQEIYNGIHTQCVIQFNEFLKEGTVMDNYVYILVLINKLRRAACHPLLGISAKNREQVVDSNDIKPSTKITAMMHDIKQYLHEKRKIVLFSQWTSMLDIVQHFLNAESIKFGRYDGKMTVDQRNEAIVDFKTNDDVGVMLVSLKAGGQGLNLCEASVVMFADHWWNGAAEDQATDRIHRIGQTRSVDIIKYTTCNTIEENVLKLQKKKRAHEQAIIGDPKAFNKLEIEDLKLLFKLDTTDDTNTANDNTDPNNQDPSTQEQNNDQNCQIQ